MTKGALYWRLKDKKTGKWTYRRATVYHEFENRVIVGKEEE